MSRLPTPHELGVLGEQVAADHLSTLGYDILDRNWSWQKGELDLVATQREEIVFVEVRARRSQVYGTPEESISRSKRDKLIQSAQAYLGNTNRHDVDWRIDVIAIEMEQDGRVLRLEHIVSAIEGG